MRRSLLAAVAAVASLLACKSDAPKEAPPSLAPSATVDAAAPPSTGPGVSAALARLQLAGSMRTTDYCVAVRDVYWKKGQPQTVRAFFAPGPAGDAASSALAKSIADAIAAGVTLERFEVRGAHATEGAARMTVDVLEWTKKGSEDRCRTYTVPWLQQGDGLYRDGEMVDVRDAKCPGGA